MSSTTTYAKFLQALVFVSQNLILTKNGFDSWSFFSSAFGSRRARRLHLAGLNSARTQRERRQKHFSFYYRILSRRKSEWSLSRTVSTLVHSFSLKVTLDYVLHDLDNFDFLLFLLICKYHFDSHLSALHTTIVVWPMKRRFRNRTIFLSAVKSKLHYKTWKRSTARIALYCYVVSADPANGEINSL